MDEQRKAWRILHRILKTQTQMQKPFIQCACSRFVDVYWNFWKNGLNHKGQFLSTLKISYLTTTGIPITPRYTFTFCGFCFTVREEQKKTITKAKYTLFKCYCFFFDERIGLLILIESSFPFQGNGLAF